MALYLQESSVDIGSLSVQIPKIVKENRKYGNKFFKNTKKLVCCGCVVILLSSVWLELPFENDLCLHEQLQNDIHLEMKIPVKQRYVVAQVYKHFFQLPLLVSKPTI